jgi:putative ABC transport system substrate-binding protein
VVEPGELVLDCFHAADARLPIVCMTGKVDPELPDTIRARGDPQIATAKRATTTIPIVMVHAADPVEAGYVANLARPGGNITGLTFEASTESEGKRLEILKEIVPRLSRVAILRQVDAGSAETFAGIEAAARGLGVTLEVVDIRVLEDFENAFKVVMSGHPGALSVTGAH